MKKKKPNVLAHGIKSNTSNGKMSRNIGIVLCLMLQLCRRGSTMSEAHCPSRCQCFTPTKVFCSEERMYALPWNISAQVEELVVMTTGLVYPDASAFRDGLRLAKLIFLNNPLRDVPAKLLEPLDRLEELEISGNPWLERLHAGTFEKQTNLTGLLLNFNKFQTVTPGLFDSLRKLETLQLKGNSISRLPSLLFQNLRCLRSLDVSQNVLAEVDGDLLAGLIGLRSLRLSYNLIARLSADSFRNVSELTALHLDGNRISDLPRGVFSNLTKLEVLNLRGNSIANLTRGTFPPSVKDLNLKGNRLAELSSDAFGDLASLAHLFLSANLLSDLPADVFWSLAALQVVDLSDNRLTSLPEKIFYELFNITEIHLQNNNLSSVERLLFEDQHLLERMSLSGNNLRTLPAGFFDHSFSQCVVRLHGNPWICDCNMRYMHTWVENNHRDVEELSRVFCAGPESLRGQGLAFVDRAQLVCSRESGGPEEGRPRPSKCTLQAEDDTVVVKCEVMKCSPLRLKVQFHESDGNMTEHIVEKEWPQCPHNVAMGL